MPASEQADEQFLNHVILADDDLGDLGAKPPVVVRQGGDGRDLVLGGLAKIGSRHRGKSFNKSAGVVRGGADAVQPAAPMRACQGSPGPGQSFPWSAGACFRFRKREQAPALQSAVVGSR